MKAKGNKRRRGVERIDRLSDLPDGILHHILSFLDSKSLVGSSILSRRWRCVWKEVPVLNFDGRSLMTRWEGEGFVRHVEQVLSNRSDCNVCEIGIFSGFFLSKGMLERVMTYAASHGIQQLSLRWRILSGDFALISTCYRSLKVLNLQRVDLDSTAFGLLSHLKVLEALILRSCRFDLSGVEKPYALFDTFPKLETLKIFDSVCFWGASLCGFKISGLQLLTLEVHALLLSSLEIDAPKLVSFSYMGNIYIDDPQPLVCKMNLPSLDHATVILAGSKALFARDFNDDDQKQLVLQHCVNLFLGLHNVESLWLHLDMIKLLIQACDLVKHQPSPFRRLKSLSLLYSTGSSFVPKRVIRYFLEGSPNLEEKSIMVERRPFLKYPHCCSLIRPFKISNLSGISAIVRKAVDHKASSPRLRTTSYSYVQGL